jgi:methionyl-tRNA formyltransferase
MAAVPATHGGWTMADVPLRVVIVSRFLPIVLAFDQTIRAAGHEPVGLLTLRELGQRRGDVPFVDRSLNEVDGTLDILMPARRSAIAPLLAAVTPDLVVCIGFPWKIPSAALAVPRLGWLNCHPSLLPRHRGPIPIAWAIRNGDETIGLTVHRMDAQLDTGPIFAQRSMALEECIEPGELFPRLDGIACVALTDALERVAAGDPGEEQKGGEYETIFSDDDAWLDLKRPAREVHRLVWAWRYGYARGVQGALTKLDGKTVRVLASSLTDVAGARCVQCVDAPLWLLRTEPVEQSL